VPVFFTDDNVVDMKSLNDSRHRTFVLFSPIIDPLYFGGYAALFRSSSAAHYNCALLTESTYCLLAVSRSSLTM